MCFIPAMRAPAVERSLRMFSVVTALCLWPAIASAQWPIDPKRPDDKKSDERFEDVVQIEILPTIDQIAPGETFELAVYFDIRRDWQIFWQNPSESKHPADASRATTIEVTVPEGFKTGDVRYPAPTGWNLPEGRREFVYEDATALFVEIEAPDEFAESAEIEFEVLAKWSTRKRHADSVYRYQRKATHRVPVAEAGRKPRPANEEKLDPIRERLPKPWEEAQDIKAAWRGSVLNTYLEFTFTDVDHVDFFPLEDKLNPNEYLRREIGPGEVKDTVVMKVYYSAVNASALQPVVCNGVVLQQRGEDIESFRVKLPRPLRERYDGSIGDDDPPG